MQILLACLHVNVSCIYARTADAFLVSCWSSLHKKWSETILTNSSSFQVSLRTLIFFLSFFHQFFIISFSGLLFLSMFLLAGLLYIRNSQGTSQKLLGMFNIFLTESHSASVMHSCIRFCVFGFSNLSVFHAPYLSIHIISKRLCALVSACLCVFAGVHMQRRHMSAYELYPSLSLSFALLMCIYINICIYIYIYICVYVYVYWTTRAYMRIYDICIHLCIYEWRTNLEIPKPFGITLSILEINHEQITENLKRLVESRFALIFVGFPWLPLVFLVLFVGCHEMSKFFSGAHPRLQAWNCDVLFELFKQLSTIFFALFLQTPHIGCNCLQRLSEESISHESFSNKATQETQQQ